mmetsp:Transcript_12770/g.34562  ORF Transcript_12770/g.34562 Transcript_12770/m.34562 type:complete len:180 (-) Transcript_12770:36-575(-)
MLLRPEASPQTVAHVCRLVEGGLYDGCYFYRSDFVLQWGLWLPGPEEGQEKEVPNPQPDLPENETRVGTFLSNSRGTAAVAHQLGLNGNAELFINLQDNEHLDTMSFGFCVWAQLADGRSLQVVRDLAAAVLEGKRPVIRRAFLKTPGEVVKVRWPMQDLFETCYREFASRHVYLDGSS